MYELAEIKAYKQEGDITQFIVSVSKNTGNMIIDKHIKCVELRLDDGRSISAEQRKKAYATIRDIAAWISDAPERIKSEMKTIYYEQTGEEYISLGDCTMDQAREFINVITEFAIYHGIPLKDFGVNRTDDISKFLYFCLKHKKCAVCGREGEIHHVDAIGMGNDRRKVDDSNYRKLCLCRMHHTIAHQRGMTEFEQMYKVYGIVYKDEAQPKA